MRKCCVSNVREQRPEPTEGGLAVAGREAQCSDGEVVDSSVDEDYIDGYDNVKAACLEVKGVKYQRDKELKHAECIHYNFCQSTQLLPKTLSHNISGYRAAMDKPKSAKNC